MRPRIVVASYNRHQRTRIVCATCENIYLRINYTFVKYLLISILDIEESSFMYVVLEIVLRFKIRGSLKKSKNLLLLNNNEINYCIMKLNQIKVKETTVAV